MILSDREIKAAIARGAVSLEPVPGDAAWTSTAIDLELDRELISWRVPSIGGVVSHVSPANRDYNFPALRASHSTAHTCDGTPGFIMEPGAFVLGWTVEKIYLPYQGRIAARVEGKSSLARLGVGIHVTAPTIHAGFGFSPAGRHGAPLQLEIWNAGPLRVELAYMMRVCQLIFEWVDGTPMQGYSGQFSGQGPAAPPARRAGKG